MITCIVLAAGLSTRFGSSKALARMPQSTVIEHLQQMLLATSLDQIVVVLGHQADQIRPSIFIQNRIRVVYNKDYNFGQVTSVKEGWRQAENSDGVMFLPVDCPLVRPATVEAVITEFNKKKPDILIPSYQGKKGHPPVFHQRLKAKVLALPLEKGLNSLFKDHPPRVMEIDDPGIVQSFNTPQEFEAIISRL